MTRHQRTALDGGAPMTPPTTQVRRSRAYRVVMSPKTLWLFAKYFRLAGEPAWIKHAIAFTWRTL